MRTRLRYLFAGALSLLAVVRFADGIPLASASADWPTHPVRFILTLGPGSGSDIEARLFADRLSQRWSQPVVVENRPGGDGIVAINAFVAAHDDQVLLFAPTSSFTAHPFLHDHLPYRPDDLVPIARVSNTIIAISVPTTLGVNSLDQLVALARSEPGKLNWAGVTGALDFMFAGWLKEEGLDISKVAYKNPVDAANDLAEGRVQVYEFGAGDRAAATAIRKDQAARREQYCARADRAGPADGEGSGLSGADAGRLGRLIRTDRHAARAPPTDHRRRRSGGRCDHQGSAGRHGSTAQCRRS